MTWNSAPHEDGPMNHGKTQSRLASLEAGRVSRDPDVDLQRMADQFGVSPNELRAEGEAVAEMCRRAGAESLDACIEVNAADAGISVVELRDEMATYRSWGRPW